MDPSWVINQDFPSGPFPGCVEAIGWFEDFLRNRDPSAAPRESYVQEIRVTSSLVAGGKKKWDPNEVFSMVLCYKKLGKWPFIVSFPIQNGGSFHSYVENCMVYLGKRCSNDRFSTSMT